MNTPTTLPDDLYRRELDRRALIVSHCFKEAWGTIPSESNLARALKLVEDILALGPRSDPSIKLSTDMAWAAGLIWRLAFIFQTLLERKISFRQHLKTMRSGNLRFGQKDAGGSGEFKDFELELCIAAQLCDRSNRPIVLHEPGHPFDITFGEVIKIECKHPSSEKKIASAITDFGKALKEENAEGFFVLAMEDVLELGNLPVVSSTEETMLIAQARFDEVLALRFDGWAKNFTANDGILGVCIQSSAQVFLRVGPSADSFILPLTRSIRLRESPRPLSNVLLGELLTALR